MGFLGGFLHSNQACGQDFSRKGREFDGLAKRVWHIAMWGGLAAIGHNYNSDSSHSSNETFISIVILIVPCFLISKGEGELGMRTPLSTGMIINNEEILLS